ncbi:MAG: helix-turn-helix transcriptional regulator [Clostridiales bacterium]|nr:helix-turn-helix transcriptional regulator [Clostridiales bacterium]
MNLKQTIVNRMMQICNERGIKPNELAVLSGTTPSAVYSFLDSMRNEIYISTIKKIYDGLEMTFGEFFSTSEFDNLEQKIK